VTFRLERSILRMPHNVEVSMSDDVACKSEHDARRTLPTTHMVLSSEEMMHISAHKGVRF
jgi:hypothetical protein